MRLGALLSRILPESVFLRIKYYYKCNQKHLSQVGQDQWVFGEVFDGRKHGFFVEIGSSDGVTLNNTFLLETRYKWDGICIEADPAVFKQLEKFRRVTCLNQCLDDQEGEVEFRSQGLLSGIVSNETDNRPEGRESEEKLSTIKMRTKPLATVLKEYNAPRTIDYLSIDCEGAEERIMKNFPFEEYKFICITIERPSPLLRDVLARNQYVIVKEIPGLDVFYLHEDFEDNYHRNAVNFWTR